MVIARSSNFGVSSNFTKFGKGFLNPSLYLACGVGEKMSRVTFNRKRVKLKKLLGIRARLALLALMLVAPLMLERVRSLEDTRGKQIALASQEFASRRSTAPIPSARSFPRSRPC